MTFVGARIALLIVAFIVAAGFPSLSRAQYLDNNPDVDFAEVYKKLGVQIPESVARDPSGYLDLDALRREPCDQKAVGDLADLLEKMSYRRVAGDSLFNFVRACGAPTMALFHSVNIFLALSDYDRAIEVADEFVRRAPLDYNARYLRGLAFEGSGAHQYAVTDFANAIELYSDDKRTITSKIFLQMAAAYAGMGEYCEAMTPIQTWIAIDPSSRDTGPTRQIIADYASRGNCVIHSKGAQERFALRGSANTVVVKAEINSVKGNFMIDTGASYVVVSSDFGNRANIPRPAHAEIKFQTANGIVTGILTKANNVKLGKLDGDAIPTVVEEGGQGLGKAIDGLLGMSFLSRFDMQLAKGFIEIKTR